MIRCKHCDTMNYSYDRRCTTCGHKLPKPLYKKWWFWTIIGIASFIFMVKFNTISDNTTTPPVVTAQTSTNSIHCKSCGKQIESGNLCNVCKTRDKDITVEKSTSTGYITEGNNVYSKYDEHKCLYCDNIISYTNICSECIAKNEAKSKQVSNFESTSVESKGSTTSSVKTVNAFKNKTISGKIVEIVFSDAATYMSSLIDVPEDYIIMYLTVEMTNISSSDNYVSMGDFRCYVDNFLFDCNVIGSKNYNANISPGRSVQLKGAYIVPKKYKSIELEYCPIGESHNRIIIKLN